MILCAHHFEPVICISKKHNAKRKAKKPLKMCHTVFDSTVVSLSINSISSVLMGLPALVVMIGFTTVYIKYPFLFNSSVQGLHGAIDFRVEHDVCEQQDRLVRIPSSIFSVLMPLNRLNMSFVLMGNFVTYRQMYSSMVSVDHRF